MKDSPARRLRDALEPIAASGFASPAVRSRLRALGLRGVEGYVWSRAAALGDPHAAVVVSAFGVFEPAMLGGAYDAAHNKVTREDVLAARVAGAIEALTAVLPDEELVGRLGDVLLATCAGLEGTARPLFAGLRSLPIPEDPHGRLWRGADMMREHRGDGHLAACIAAGLDAVEMNVLTELAAGYALGEYASTRGWSADRIDASIASLAARGLVAHGNLTDAGQRLRDDVEAATDVTQGAMVRALGDDLEWVVTTASRFAELVVAAGAFTSDGRKRAAG